MTNSEHSQEALAGERCGRDFLAGGCVASDLRNCKTAKAKIITKEMGRKHSGWGLSARLTVSIGKVI